MQRARGEGRILVKRAGGRTRIDRLFQDGAAKIRVPRPVTPGLEAVLINTAGGLTGGDRMTWACEAAPGTQLTLTTQACEKTYKAADATCAEVGVSLTAGAGASLCWLPQETILFDQARLVRELDIELAADARALIVEPVIFGRKAMGEAVRSGVFRDRWRVRVQGRLVHAEDFSIGPGIEDGLAHAAAAGHARAFATLLLVGPDAEDRLAPARRVINDNGGVSAWTVGQTGKLLARVVAEDGYSLRKTLTPLIGLLNPGAGLPKIWSI
ncbi:urease accessory protein UreD [Pseudohoeflea suaedae]|uniref:Urease accessory protein UreD n=1 Tax=Pseudohoeflea suaedae TaxID=877384 RepID=A0A4R5PRE0_9HYPH|nr:urease accessory protein UreD [Pseudohoeflea suaedae]